MSSEAGTRHLSRAGFTLIEILLGLSLLAIVLTLVQGVYSGTIRSRDRAEEQAEKSHSAALLLHRMADELASSILPEEDSENGVTLEKDENLDSRVEFSTPLPALVQEEDAAPAGGPARITYHVEANESGGRDLLRLDSRAPSSSDSKEGGDVLLRGISRFRVKLLGEGDKWEETFESSGVDEKPPRAVAIEVAWKEGKKDDGPERVLRTLIPLYSGLDRP